MYNGVLIADGVGKDFILPKIAGFRIPKWRPTRKETNMRDGATMYMYISGEF